MGDAHSPTQRAGHVTQGRAAVAHLSRQRKQPTHRLAAVDHRVALAIGWGGHGEAKVRLHSSTAGSGQWQQVARRHRLQVPQPLGWVLQQGNKREAAR